MLLSYFPELIIIIIFFKYLVLPVLGQSDFLHSRSGSTWAHTEHTLDDDSSGLDYMLALSLQTEGDTGARGVEGNVWSGIWDHKIGKSNTSLSNNNYPDFTVESSTSAVQDHDQKGELMFAGNIRLFGYPFIDHFKLFPQMQCCLVNFARSCFQKTTSFYIRFEIAFDWCFFESQC